VKKLITACGLLEWLKEINGADEISSRSNKADADERMTAAVGG
jgi:hypothetical protein